ncbi:syntaxin-2-like isoform X2 [Nerophis ophidion]|uniref:syntaxin-2-like isoform X2 n=1 Tax=Nerophis ophidion TaxID=159077 RepID=UPI002ADF1289|nr:syntaxin-2-like isoform X2 [Nerophis ophidion]
MADATRGTYVMEEFFKTVGELRSLLQKMSCQVAEVEKRQSAILALSKPDKTSQDGVPVDDSGDGASVMQRIKKNQHEHLTRCFADVMTSHHKTQVAFREKCKAYIQRQLQIVDKVTTDEEMEEMLNCDNVTVFISDISLQARMSSEALSEIESRHEDIVRLEASIRELHEILSDTALLLEIQGELVNSIEKNVARAADYVDVSKAKTHKAVIYKKNPTKIVSLPSFLKSFRRQASTKTTTGPSTSHPDNKDRNTDAL